MGTVKCSVIHSVVGCEVEVDGSLFEYNLTRGQLSDEYAPVIILADQGLVFMVPFVVDESGVIEAQIIYLVPDKTEKPGPLMILWEEGRQHGPYPTFEQVASAFERAHNRLLNRQMN